MKTWSRWIFFIICLMTGGFFIGAQDSTSLLQNESEESHEPVVALVLAGGGALGFAHVGVIKVLEEEGIQPDIVIGTSIGSIVGGLYSIGYTAQEMQDVIEATDWKEVFYDSYDRRSFSYEQKERQSTHYLTIPIQQEKRVGDAGVSQAQQVVELLDRLMWPVSSEISYDELPRQFRVVAADLITGERVVFQEGDLKTSIRASMSVPGVFAPVNYKGRTLVDGGLADNIPATIAREMGADIIITVQLLSMRDRAEELTTIPNILMQTEQIYTRERVVAGLEASDLVITPDLDGFTMADFERDDVLMELGYEAADRQREAIQQIFQEQGERPQPNKIPQMDDSISIRQVRVETYGDLEKQTQLEQEITLHLREPIGAIPLRDYLYTFYDSGDFTHFWYRLVPIENGEYILCIDAPVYLAPPRAVHVGGGFHSQLINSFMAEIYFNGAFTQWFGQRRNHSVTADFKISEFPEIRLTYDINPSIFQTKIRTQAYYFQNPRYFYDKYSLLSTYSLVEYGGSLTVKQPLFHRLELSLGIFIDYNHIQFHQGERAYPIDNWFQGGGRVMFAYDDLNRLIVPQQGLKMEVFLESSSNEEELEAFQIKFVADSYLPLDDQKSIVFRTWVEGHSLLGGNLHNMEQPFLGNALDLYGYYPQEIHSDNVCLVGIALRKKIASLPLGAGDDLYLQLGGNIAASWTEAVADHYESEQWYSAYTIGLLARTIVGELQFSFALNDEFRPSTAISLRSSLGLLNEF